MRTMSKCLILVECYPEMFMVQSNYSGSKFFLFPVVICEEACQSFSQRDERQIALKCRIPLPRGKTYESATEPGSEPGVSLRTLNRYGI